MGRVFLILLLIAAIPYSLNVWWKVRRVRSERERSFIVRTHIAVAIFAVLAVLAFVMLTMRGQFFALPLIGAAGLAMRQGIRKARARIQAEESDPLSRAKRVN
jgi:hypothetical protein